MRRFVRHRPAARAAAVIATALASGALVTGTAAATTFSWSVGMSGQDVIASHLPAIASATGSASITGDDVANRMCGTFSWSGVADPVAFGHIHEGQYGVPENPGFTINLFGPDLNGAPNPVTGCTIVPGPVITEMASFPWAFNVVIHNKAYPAGAIRGQLGSGALICQLKPSLCPGPLGG